MQRRPRAMKSRVASSCSPKTSESLVRRPKGDRKVALVEFNSRPALLRRPLSVQREQTPDIGRDAVRQSLFVLLLVAVVVEYRATRELPAREVFAQLLGQVGASLEQRGERVLGYLVNHDPGERGEFAIHRLTGEQSDLAEIISRRQSGDLDLAAIFLR